MNFETIHEFDIPATWRKVVSKINKVGDILEIKAGSECVETKKLALSIIIDHPEIRPLVDDKCITTNMEKVQAYALEYLWTDSCHYETGEEYTYGSRLRTPVDQIQKAIELMANEPNNRQITLTIRRPEDISSPHPPCLTMIDLEVLENKLNLYGYFRSWDAYAGLPENIAGLQLFNKALVNEVNETNSKLSLQTGKLVFFSKNCHLYKRQYEWADKLELNGQDSRRIKNCYSSDQ